MGVLLAKLKLLRASPYLPKEIVTIGGRTRDRFAARDSPHRALLYKIRDSGLPQKKPM